MFRLTIRQGMLLIAGVAGLAGLIRILGFAPLLPAVAAIPPLLVWVATRRHPRWVVRSFAALAVSLNVATWGFQASLPGMPGLALSVLALVAAAPSTLVAGISWATTRRERSGSRVWPGVLALGSVLLPVTMLTGWPLAVAFAASRPAMDRLADRVLAGEAVAWPVQAGIYRVVGSSQLNSNVALILDPNPNGNTGFVRVTNPDLQGPLTNLNFDIPAGGRWYYQQED